MKLRSVNLGGWFVLERWMRPSLFEGTEKGCNDETCFSIQLLDKDQRLEDHYKTWITKEDLIWLKDNGINNVRIPIPWWLFGEGVYHSSVEAIDHALDMLDEIGLDYMLDLHTAPGCQNGFDNGGIQYVVDWPKDPKNIDKTIEILVKVMKRYNERPHFHSIQLLNEPHVEIDLQLLQDFYIRSYNQLRDINKDRYIVMHDGFRLHAWKEFFEENNFHHVIFDTHMYQCFDDRSGRNNLEQHVQQALTRIDVLQKVEAYVPVIVGEWSLGLRMNEHLEQQDHALNMKAYASAQLQAMKHCTGHVFWSFKVEDEKSGWNFRKLVERNIIDIKEFQE